MKSCMKMQTQNFSLLCSTIVALCLSLANGRAYAQGTPQLQVPNVQLQAPNPQTLRQQQRAHARLVQQQIRLEPEYGSIQNAAIGSTVLYVGAVLSGLTCVGALVVDLFRGVTFSGNRDRVSDQDRIWDLSIAGIAGAAFVVTLVSAISIRHDRTAQYEVLRERVERRLSVSAVAPYANATGGGVVLTGEFQD